jgi:hypothetical protein
MIQTAAVMDQGEVGAVKNPLGDEASREDDAE